MISGAASTEAPNRGRLGPGEVGDPARLGARRAHLRERTLAVAGVDVDGADRVLEHDNVEPERACIEHRLADAVISGEAGDKNPLDAARPQPVTKLRVLERRVRLAFRVGALVHHVLDASGVQPLVKRRTRGFAHAVGWPRPPTCLERHVVAGVPVAAGCDDVKVPRGGVDSVEDAITVWHRQCATGTEIDLRVDDEQGIAGSGLETHAVIIASGESVDLNEPVLLTPEGLERLKKELELARARRVEAADRLKEAFQPGDIEDNPEYEQAKEEVSLLDGRIYELEEMIGRAQILHEHHGSVAEPGSTIEVEEEDGTTSTYHLVGAVESDPSTGRISVESPVGRALVGKRKGDRVSVSVPSGTLTLTVTAVH